MSANDPFGLTASGIPPELQAQYRGLSRDQAIQEALLQQSQQPIGGVLDAGMFKVARSPLEGIAKLVQAYTARKGLNESDKRFGALGDRAAQMQADEIRRYQQAKMGAPGSSEQIIDETANGGEGAPATINAPAVPGDPRAAITQALMSRNPMLNRLAVMDNTQLNRVEDRKATQDFQAKEHERQAKWRTEDIQMRLREGRITKKEADARMADLRREMQDAQLANSRALAGIAAANRNPPAPSITQIVDPKDKTKMISVDTRKYDQAKYLAGDTSGVVGMSGKEPSAAKKDEQAGQGAQALSDSIATLRGFYDTLDQNGAIVNPKNSSLSNLSASAGASGVGQFLGGLVGTKNQTVRDSINMQRPLLLQAIKQATGMSAKQMDSNAELKLWLASATDPTKSVQANREALDSIERKYLSNGKGAGGSGDFGDGKVMKFDAQGNPIP